MIYTTASKHAVHIVHNYALLVDSHLNPFFVFLVNLLSVSTQPFVLVF